MSVCTYNLYMVTIFGALTIRYDMNENIFHSTDLSHLCVSLRIRMASRDFLLQCHVVICSSSEYLKLVIIQVSTRHQQSLDKNWKT